MYTLKNDKLEISVKKTGAELCKITSIKNKAEFMWDADPNVWGSFAPNLFPIIGALKDDTYIFENEKYELPFQKECPKIDNIRALITDFGE